MFIAVGLTGAAGLWAFVVLLRQLYYICQPSEVLIFAGLGRTTGDGRKVGYRTVRGGSALRRAPLPWMGACILPGPINWLRLPGKRSRSRTSMPATRRRTLRRST